MPGFGSSGNSKESKCGCADVGFPVDHEKLFEVKAEQDLADAPLVPAELKGHMDGMDFINETCNDLTLLIEYYSTNSDCDGCTTDKPKLLVKKHVLPKGKHFNYGGLIVDYQIVSSEPMLQDGCVRVMGGRTTSNCCKYPGITTTLNKLEIPTI